MRKLGLWLGLLFLSSAGWAFDNLDKITKIETGMTKDEVFEIIGPPDVAVSNAVNAAGKQVDVYRYNYAAPLEEPVPAKEPFIKPEFSRDAKNSVTQDAEAEKAVIINPSYLIHYVDGAVQSVEKS